MSAETTELGVHPTFFLSSSTHSLPVAYLELLAAQRPLVPQRTSTLASRHNPPWEDPKWLRDEIAAHNGRGEPKRGHRELAADKWGLDEKTTDPEPLADVPGEPNWVAPSLAALERLRAWSRIPRSEWSSLFFESLLGMPPSSKQQKQQKQQEEDADVRLALQVLEHESTRVCSGSIGLRSCSPELGVLLGKPAVRDLFCAALAHSFNAPPLDDEGQEHVLACHYNVLVLGSINEHRLASDSSLALTTIPVFAEGGHNELRFRRVANVCAKSLFFWRRTVAPGHDRLLRVLYVHQRSLDLWDWDDDVDVRAEVCALLDKAEGWKRVGGAHASNASFRRKRPCFVVISGAGLLHERVVDECKRLVGGVMCVPITQHQAALDLRGVVTSQWKGGLRLLASLRQCLQPKLIRTMILTECGICVHDDMEGLEYIANKFERLVNLDVSFNPLGGPTFAAFLERLMERLPALRVWAHGTGLEWPLFATVNPTITVRLCLSHHMLDPAEREKYKAPKH